MFHYMELARGDSEVEVTLDGALNQLQAQFPRIILKARADGRYRDTESWSRTHARQQNTQSVNLRRHRAWRKAETIPAGILDHLAQPIEKLVTIAPVAHDVVADDEFDVVVRQVGHGRHTPRPDAQWQTLARLQRSHTDRVGGFLAAGAAPGAAGCCGCARHGW